MHEKEAKTKWCPFSRTLERAYNEDFDVIGVISVNRGHVNHTRCLGSGCMAWSRGTAEGYGRCGLAKGEG